MLVLQLQTNFQKDKTNCHVAEEGWTQEITDAKDSITCGRSNPETQRHWKECTCRTVGTRGLQDKEGEGGPWHRLKTVFLVIIIVLLAIWLVVYVLLSRKSLIH